jgi:hypothetical protein
MFLMRTFILLVLCLTVAPLAASGPEEFGLAELERAYSDRKLAQPTIPLQSEVSVDRPETFRINAARVPRISGGDLRGLMYGLIEAAEQIRERGKLAAASGSPALPLRGLRMVLRPADTQAVWFRSSQRWREFFSNMARSRLNRLALVFLDQPGAPMDVEALASISSVAAEFAVDMSVGLRIQDLLAENGVTASEAGMRGQAFLQRLLVECPAVRSVRVIANEDSRDELSLAKEWLFRAVGEAGRRMTLELIAPRSAVLVEAAMEAGVPLRLGRPYGSGASSFVIEESTPFWCLEASGSGIPAQWSDLAYVRRAVAEFVKSGLAGFEIDTSAISGTAADSRPYMLWGRLGYDPKIPDASFAKGAKQP